jgi:hypothetical protein
MHDEDAIATRLLDQGVELGHGIIKSMLRKTPGTIA